MRHHAPNSAKIWVILWTTHHCIFSLGRPLCLPPRRSEIWELSHQEQLQELSCWEGANFSSQMTFFLKFWTSVGVKPWARELRWLILACPPSACEDGANDPTGLRFSLCHEMVWPPTLHDLQKDSSDIPFIHISRFDHVIVLLVWFYPFWFRPRVCRSIVVQIP